MSEPADPPPAPPAPVSPAAPAAPRRPFWLRAGLFLTAGALAAGASVPAVGAVRRAAESLEIVEHAPPYSPGRTPMTPELVAAIRIEEETVRRQASVVATASLAAVAGLLAAGLGVAAGVAAGRGRSAAAGLGVGLAAGCVAGACGGWAGFEVVESPRVRAASRSLGDPDLFAVTAAYLVEFLLAGLAAAVAVRVARGPAAGGWRPALAAAGGGAVAALLVPVGGAVLGGAAPAVLGTRGFHRAVPEEPAALLVWAGALALLVALSLARAVGAAGPAAAGPAPTPAAA